MDYKLKNQVIKYLNKFYYTKEALIFNKNSDYHEWGVEVAEYISEAFTCDINECFKLVIEWAEGREDIKPSDINGLWGPKTLKFKMSIEVSNDLVRLGISNVQSQINDLIINGLSKEIDVTILNKLKDDIKTTDELISLIKCIGYDTSSIIYDATTFAPIRKFSSVKYHEMINERQSNHIWQNHFRPTRIDEQTQVTS